MARINRLTSSADFRRVLARGKRIQTPGAIVITVPGDPDRPARVGVVATRKLGGAVTRNRAKRLLREAARASDVPSGTDAVLIARPGIIGKTFQSLVADIAAALRQVVPC